MRLTGNPRGVQILIVAALIVTLWISCTRNADARETFFAGAGVSYMSTRQIAHGLRFGVERDAWQFAIVTHGDGAAGDDNGNTYMLDANLAACASWHAQRRKFSIGWGACAYEHGDFAVGDGVEIFEGSEARLEDSALQLTGTIVVRRAFGERERVYLELYHASSAGSTRYNRGRNILLFGLRL